MRCAKDVVSSVKADPTGYSRQSRQRWIICVSMLSRGPGMLLVADRSRVFACQQAVYCISTEVSYESIQTSPTHSSLSFYYFT